MMANSSAFKKLLYEHEVLWAKYDIRDHNLNKIVEDVYQNIGQVLTLIRIQLSLLSNSNETAEPGNLLGNVIRELRGMCKNLYPEKELLGTSGLIKTLENELSSSGFIKSENVIKVEGLPVSLSAGMDLVVFRMLQEMLLSIRQVYQEVLVEIKITYQESDVTFMIEYTGQPVEWEHFNQQAEGGLALSRLSLLERAGLINAKLQIGQNKAGKTVVMLVVPFETSVADGS